MIYVYRNDGELMGEFPKRKDVINRFHMSKSTLSKIMTGQLQSWLGKYYFLEFEVKDFESFITIHNASIQEAAMRWNNAQILPTEAEPSY